MRSAAAAVLLILAACTAPEAQSPTTEPTPAVEAPTQPATAGCDLEISFGSYGGGANDLLRTRVRDYLNGDAGLRTLSERPWGREGESDFCVVAVDDAAADRFYRTIAGWMPPTSRLHPNSIKHRDGRSHQTTWPQETAP